MQPEHHPIKVTPFFSALIDYSTLSIISKDDRGELLTYPDPLIVSPSILL